MSNRTLTIHLPAEIADRIDQLAKQNSRSRNWIAEQAIADWFAWEEEKHQMILQALEDVEQNRFYSRAEMVSWAESQTSRNAA
jgi:predicted transcriptional regulator